MVNGCLHWEGGLVHWAKNMQITSWWTRRHKPLSVGSELPQHPSSHLGEVETIELFWLKAPVSIHSHQGTKIYYLWIPETRGLGRGAVSWERQPSIPGCKWAGDREQGSELLLTFKIVGVEVTSFLRAQPLSDYLKRYPEKSKARPRGGNPKFWSFLNV